MQSQQSTASTFFLAVCIFYLLSESPNAVSTEHCIKYIYNLIGWILHVYPWVILFVLFVFCGVGLLLARLFVY